MFRRVLVLLLAVVLIGAGGYLTWTGFHQPPPPTPDLEASIVATPGQAPVGPTEAEVVMGEGREIVSETTMAPNKLFVPALNIYADIDKSGDFGSVIEGEFILPPEDRVAQWRDGGGVTDDEGNLVLAGHVSYNGNEGALYDLAGIKAGHLAFVSDGEGNVEEYQLYKADSYTKTVLPESIWTDEGSKKLTIITCGGEMIRYDDGSWHYDSNIVATFVPVA